MSLFIKQKSKDDSSYKFVKCTKAMKLRNNKEGSSLQNLNAFDLNFYVCVCGRVLSVKLKIGIFQLNLIHKITNSYFFLSSSLDLKWEENYNSSSS